MNKLRLLLPSLIGSILLLSILTAGASAPAQAPAYHGNFHSHIFHRQSCRFFDCQACTVAFNSRDDAIKAGYRPCKVCNP